MSSVLWNRLGWEELGGWEELVGWEAAIGWAANLRFLGALLGCDPRASRGGFATAGY